RKWLVHLDVMTRRVLEVGNCDYDHRTLAAVLSAQFSASVIRAHGISDALGALEQATAEHTRFDLVLVNRLMDRDGAEGIEIIRAIQRDPRFQATPVMMITNFEEHQRRATAEGAVPGFGKAQVHAAQTQETLRPYLA
ncbi:MAG TPA: response regulator, partial [Pirellulaceae bacterium]